MKGWQAVLLSVVLTLVCGTLITRFLMGYTTIKPRVEAALTTDGAPDPSVYGAMLHDYATPAGFRYDAARQDLRLEQSYAYFAAQALPTASDDARLAHDINAYNLLVVIGISRNWPIENIEDMASAIEPIYGFGYFQARRYLVAGEKVSLHALDQRIRQNARFDVRVPFFQACGLGGCARLHNDPIDAEHLDEALDDAMVRFITNPQLVRVNRNDKTIEAAEALLAIEGPLVEFAKTRGYGDDLRAIIRHYGERSTALVNAIDEGFELKGIPFSFDVVSAR